jgi:hypothetical protein
VQAQMSEGDLEVGMTKIFKIVIVLCGLAAASWGQGLFDVQVKGRQRWPAAEAEKLYLSACAAVQKEFRSTRPMRPRITLVLGAENNEARLETREIRLTRWNSYLFTEGVVIFAFEDLMPIKDRMTMARRAINWADASVDVDVMSK